MLEDQESHLNASPGIELHFKVASKASKFSVILKRPELCSSTQQQRCSLFLCLLVNQQQVQLQIFTSMHEDFCFNITQYLTAYQSGKLLGHFCRVFLLKLAHLKH